ncbi:DUF6332 family protein, partial [Streptomyces rimosus]|uniref:DUF6332 family protein n=1 Tax=Streptomyces rimosus TaxID=1927 RepID=UPI001F42D650
MTVEIGFALLTGVFVAALAFGAVLSPLLFTDPGRTGTGVLLAAAGSAAGVAFVWRGVGGVGGGGEGGIAAAAKKALNRPTAHHPPPHDKLPPCLRPVPRPSVTR